MNLQIRLFRKPFTTVLWVTLVTAMTVLLCIGGALWFSSESVAGIIDDMHKTVAYRTDRATTRTETATGMSYTHEDKTLSQSSRKLLESLDCVKGIHTHTLTGGYSPSFKPLISTGAFHMVNESYDDVIVVVTVTDAVIEDDEYQETYDVSLLNLEMEDIVTNGFVRAQVHVDEFVIGSGELIGIGTPREQYDFEALFSFLNQADCSSIQVGQRYLIRVTFHTGIGLPPIDTPAHMWFVGNNLYGSNGILYATETDTSKLASGDYIPKIESFPDAQLCMAKLDGTVEEFLADPANAPWLDVFKTVEQAQHCVPILGTEALDTMHQFANSKGTIIEGRMFTQEEYDSGARVCILSNSLAAKSGIALGDTIPISQFWCADEFTRISDNYSTDQYSTDGKLNNPTVGHVGEDVEFITRDEEFTVVGIYRQSNEWGNGSYDVTPNTVYIPKKAQIPGGYGGFTRSEDVTYTNAQGKEVTTTRGVQGATWGVYMTVELKNGTVKEFKQAIAGTDLENQFIITDQGYGAILDSIRGIAESARQLLSLVAAGWALLLLLYILLYQGMQKRNLGIMRSLGATPKESGGYLWTSGMAVAVTGIALGTAISAGVMSFVQKMLFDAATYDIPLTKFSTGGEMSQTMLEEMLQRSQLSLPMLLLLAAAQIAIFAAVLWLHSHRLARKEPRILLTT